MKAKRHYWKNYGVINSLYNKLGRIGSIGRCVGGDTCLSIDFNNGYDLTITKDKDEYSLILGFLPSCGCKYINAIDMRWCFTTKDVKALIYDLYVKTFKFIRDGKDTASCMLNEKEKLYKRICA